MNKEAVFVYNLKEVQKKAWTTFLKEKDRFSRYQHPEWIQLKKAPGTACFMLLYENSQLVAVSIIIENKLAANIDFGPVCNSVDDYEKCLS